MLFAVTWIFYEWIQHPALHKHHGQAITKFQWNLLHGLRAYANLVKRFPLASFCDSKPVSHVCYCLNHNNRKSDFSKHCIKNNAMMVRLFTIAKLSNYQVWSDNQMPADNVVIKRIYHICVIYFGKWLHSKVKRNFISSFVICLSCRKWHTKWK